MIRCVSSPSTSRLRASPSSGADVTIPAGDGLYHPSVVNGRAELYSFDSPATVQGVLERAGIVCSDLRGETLNLEDAFIGLTGKY